MLGTLIRKELLEHMLSLRFLITLALCVVLIPLGIFVSIKEYENSLHDYQESQQLYLQSLQGMKNAIGVEAKGLRPPSPFSIFAGGLDKSLPNEVVSTRKEGLQLSNNRTMDSPLGTLFGNMDFLFSVSVVMSLLAILFTFDATTREKEEGTLRLILSNAVPRSSVVIAKYTGNFITFLIPFLIAMLIGTIILSITGVIPIFQPRNIGRLLSILFVSLLFISVFFNLGLMVSTLNRRSLTSQITLLLLWVLFIFAVPRISGMIAGVVYPVKTQQTINLEKSLIRKNIEDEKARALKDAFQQQLAGTPDESAPTYDEVRAPIMEELRQKEQSQLDAVERDYQNRKRTQMKIAAVVARLSPLASLTFATTELANTGLQQLDALNTSSREFHNAAVRSIHSRGYQDDIPGVGMHMSMGWVSADDIPLYQYRETDLAAGLQAGRLDLLLLFMYNILFFSVAYVGFLRYDVR
ncbi:ABC transporter permease subunit [bacterium]|nr:ABC transporter permease subunit [bacterium]